MKLNSFAIHDVAMDAHNTSETSSTLMCTLVFLSFNLELLYLEWHKGSHVYRSRTITHYKSHYIPDIARDSPSRLLPGSRIGQVPMTRKISRFQHLLFSLQPHRPRPGSRQSLSGSCFGTLRCSGSRSPSGSRDARLPPRRRPGLLLWLGRHGLAGEGHTIINIEYKL
jgi:hypothetical protein